MSAVCATCGQLTAGPTCAKCGTPVTNVPMYSLADGTLLDQAHFATESVLGQGGFGVTYRAYDHRLHRWVAIKEFMPTGCIRIGDSVYPGTTMIGSFDETRSRFIDEARVLARLRHPGIVDVFEVLEELGTAFIVMEYVHGRTLQQRLDAEGTLPVEAVLAIMRQVGDALGYLHGQNLLHRDISPSNIMEVNDRFVLIDFGAAREFLADRSSDLSRIVKPGYSPLEQYSGRGSIGPTSDVYSLCATMYHLLCGRVPPDATERVTGLDLVPIRDFVPAVPAHVAHALEAGLALRPGDRPQDVATLVAAMNGEPPAGPVAAEPTPLASGTALGVTDAVPALPRGARHKAPVLVVLAALVVLAVAAIAVLSKGSSGSDQSAATVAGDLTTSPASGPSDTIVSSTTPEGDDVNASPASTASATTPTTQVDAAPSTVPAPATGPPTQPPATLPPPIVTAPTATTPDTVGIVAGVVSRTCGAGGNGDCFVSIRAAPTAKSAEIRRLDEGTPLAVVCQVSGGATFSSVLNTKSTIWVRTAEGFYVANVFLDAPGFSVTQVTVPCGRTGGD